MYGVLFSSRNTVGILGNTTFRGSIGPAIQVFAADIHDVDLCHVKLSTLELFVQSFGSLITFVGCVTFDRNSNHPEGFSGVLHLAAFGQILLQRGVNMTFTTKGVQSL